MPDQSKTLQLSPLGSGPADWKEREGVVGGDPFAICGLWADSATYHTRDSLLPILFNVLSGILRTRFGISARSKRMQCNCGCMDGPTDGEGCESGGRARLPPQLPGRLCRHTSSAVPPRNFGRKLTKHTKYINDILRCVKIC